MPAGMTNVKLPSVLKVPSHLPAEQVHAAPAGHAVRQLFPHAPQLFGSVLVSMSQPCA